MSLKAHWTWCVRECKKHGPDCGHLKLQERTLSGVAIHRNHLSHSPPLSPPLCHALQMAENHELTHVVCCPGKCARRCEFEDASKQRREAACSVQCQKEEAGRRFTCPAPLSSKFKPLQPPLVKVKTVSFSLIFRTCAGMRLTARKEDYHGQQKRATANHSQ